MLATHYERAYSAAWVASSNQFPLTACDISARYPLGGAFKYYELVEQAQALKQAQTDLNNAIAARQALSFQLIRMLQKIYADQGVGQMIMSFTQARMLARVIEHEQEQKVKEQEHRLIQQVKAFEQRVAYLLDDLLEKEFDFNGDNSEHAGQLLVRVPFAQRFDGIFSEIDSLIAAIPPSPMRNYYRYRRMQKERETLNKYTRDLTREEVRTQSLNARLLNAIVGLKTFIRERYHQCFIFQEKLYHEIKPAIDKMKKTKAYREGQRDVGIETSLAELARRGYKQALSELASLSSEFDLSESELAVIRQAAEQGSPDANVQLARYAASQYSGQGCLNAEEVMAIQRVVQFAFQEGLVAAVDFVRSSQQTAASIRKILRANGDPIEGDHSSIIAKALEVDVIIQEQQQILKKQIQPQQNVMLQTHAKQAKSNVRLPAWLRASPATWTRHHCGLANVSDTIQKDEHRHSLGVK